MGILFVILIHLIAILIISIFIAFVASIITYFASSKEKRRRNIFFALLSPAVGLCTLYICGLTGSILISEFKNIDVGIGDSFYIPLSNNCKLSFIDEIEDGSMYNQNQSVVTEITEINESNENVFGKTKDDSYFSYNTITGHLNKSIDEKELSKLYPTIRPLLISSRDFYFKKRSDIVGVWIAFVGIISLIITFMSLFFLKKIY